MILSTTNIDPEYDVLGVVTASLTKGVGLSGDVFAKMVDFFGGTSKAYTDTVEELKSDVFNKMIESAKNLGASAIVGISTSITTLPLGRGGLIIVSAVGTAVRKRSA